MSCVKRVVIFEPGGKGGICHYTYNLCQALYRKGLDVHLITNKPYELASFPADFRTHVFRLRSTKGLIYAVKEIKDLNAKVLHYQGTNTHPAFEFGMMIAARPHRAGFVYTCHNPAPHRLPARWQIPFIGMKLRGADAVIVHSEANYEEVRARYSIEMPRIHIIPHGNYEFFKQAPRSSAGIGWEKVAGIKDILFFGAISEYKGLSYLIAAVGKLKADGFGVRLLIVGRPVEPWSKYESQIDELDLRDQVLVRLGYIPLEDIPCYFSLADCACLPYVNCTESGVTLLADAFDKPLVATRIGSLLEAFQQGYIQQLVEPANSAALAEGLRHVLYDSTYEAFLSSKSNRDTSTRDWDSIAAKTVEVYQGNEGTSLWTDEIPDRTRVN